MEKDNNNDYFDNKRYISMSNSFLHDVEAGQYEHFDVLVLSTIKIMSNRNILDSMQECCVVTMGVLLSMMKMCNNSRNKKALKESIESLVDGQVVGVYTDFSYSEKLSFEEVQALDTQDIIYIRVEEPVAQYYSRLYAFEYEKIVASGERSIGKLLHVFLYICNEIWSKGNKMTYMTNAKIVEGVKLDKKTVTKYISVLEKVEVIARVTIKNKEKNKNVMTRFAWKDCLEKL